MALVLIFVDGPEAGAELRLEPGAVITIGRSADTPGGAGGTALFETQAESKPKLRITVTENAQYQIRDKYLSKLHFRVEQQAPIWKLTDLGSTNGTTVNSIRVEETGLRDGDRIQAGGNVITVNLSTELPAKERLIRLLKACPQALYVVLDAARDPAIVPMLQSSRETYQSLYEGKAGAELDAVAPYLVRLTPQNVLLDSLVYEAWGKAWGVFLASDAPFAEIRRQLRRHLMVTSPENKRLYFRFYDPRVLREFLPACTPEELASFFGPIAIFLTEGEDPAEVRTFKPTGEMTAYVY